MSRAARYLLLLVVVSCSAAASRNEGEPRDTERVALARMIAGNMSGQASQLLALALSSRWVEGYAMRKAANPERADPRYVEIKNAELVARSRLAQLIAGHAAILSAFLVYHDVSLFAEKQYASPRQRDEWRASSTGDMFPSPFSRMSYGDHVEGSKSDEAVDIERLESGTLIGVPVVSGDRFICALYLRFSDARVGGG